MSLREHLTIGNRHLLSTVNQLVGKNWSLGLRYRISEAVANDSFAEIPGDLLGLSEVFNPVSALMPC